MYRSDSTEREQELLRAAFDAYADLREPLAQTQPKLLALITAMERLAANPELPPDHRAVVEDYAGGFRNVLGLLAALNRLCHKVTSDAEEMTPAMSETRH